MVVTLPVLAHETRPAVGDLSVQDDRVTLTLRMVLEAPLAGIDLQGLDDTNDAPEAALYDRLRQAPPAALAAQTRAAWPDLSGRIHLESGGTALRLTLEAVRVEDDPNPDLPRDSVLTVTAALPPGTAPVVFSWDPTLGPIALRQQDAGPDAYTGYLTDGAASLPIPRGGGAVAADPFDTLRAYVVIGFNHILPKGLDHILFVLGLFFFSTRMRPLLVQVTTFTVAHTVTLALATFNVISLPPTIVEPLIAASIAYIAAENIFMRRVTPWRTVVIFVFGLLHGLGFASVLGDIGLSTGQAALSLIAFNIGVELGQLTVIAAAYLAVGLWFGRTDWYRGVIAVPASVAIGIIGTYWFVERLGAFAA
ncbi:MAG: HupE/UreJ family protein [Rhodobacteraceae bacterium]|nr:HupE/UreJ family protein [Paracoccaceae bacterium]